VVVRADCTTVAGEAAPNPDVGRKKGGACE